MALFQFIWKYFDECPAKKFETLGEEKPNQGLAETALAFFLRPIFWHMRLQSVKSFLVFEGKSTYLNHISKLCWAPLASFPFHPVFFHQADILCILRRLDFPSPRTPTS